MGHRLYIWIRSDLASMTPGKAAAQVAHAASQAAFRVREMGGSIGEVKDYHKKLYGEWENSPLFEKSPQSRYDNHCFYGFGTTIVLDGVDPATMDELYYSHLDKAQISEVFRGVIVDPSYPIRDGLVTHSIEALTCIWAFLDESDKHSFLSKYELYNGNRV